MKKRSKKELRQEARRRIKARLEKHFSEEEKTDISLTKLINYNLIFFIPVLLSAVLALKIGEWATGYFQASPSIIAKILMIPFITIIFFFIVPFIRDREKVVGIRYSIFAFLLVGLGITLPSLTQGRYSLFLQLFNYFGSYILVTFIYAPEVLGIEHNVKDWFRHRKQLMIVIVYLAIVLLNVVGFGFLYHDIYTDPANPSAFNIGVTEKPDTFTFIYFSIVSFSSTGYGEITPASPAARLLFSMEAIMALVINILFIAILLVFVSNAQSLFQHREEAELKAEENKILKEEKQIKVEENKIMRQETEIEHEEGIFKKLFHSFFGPPSRKN